MKLAQLLCTYEELSETALGSAAALQLLREEEQQEIPGKEACKLSTGGTVTEGRPRARLFR